MQETLHCPWTRSLAALVLDPGASVEVALVESLLVDDVTSALVLTVVAPLGTESSEHPAAKAPRTKKMPARRGSRTTES